MGHLNLFVFGQPRLERDGKLVELNLRKALALLVYLAVTGQPHNRDALATMLWPESDGREGRGRLRRILHRLNEALGDNVLDSSQDTIRLHPDADLSLDSAAFRQHVTVGLSTAPKDAVAPERLEHLIAAVALHTADFLSGFTLPDSPTFDEWQFFQRESLRQLYGQVLEQLVQAYRSQQSWEEAITYARHWLALDALYEPAHRTLMRLYAWSGQQAAALRQYQECTRLLDAELGIAPEEETTALYEAIRTRQFGPVAAAPPPEEPAPAPPVAAGVGDEPGHTLTSQEGALFVARQRELQWLDSLLAAALGARHGVAFVIGEAGQGKTALLQRFARSSQAAHPDLIVAWGSCNAYTGAGDPYLPFREILELLTGNVDVDTAGGQLPSDLTSHLRHTLPTVAQALVDVGPDLLDTFVPTRGLLRRADMQEGGEAGWSQALHELVSRKDTRPTDPRQQDLFEQYARVMQELARHAPLLLILDDLQWTDPGSTNLLLHLSRRLKGFRVLIVGAYRPADVAIGRNGERHPLERVVGELQRDFGEIRLDLSQAEGRLLVDSLLDTQPNQLAEGFRVALYQQTGGHPLFTIELLRDLQERGALARDDEGLWVAAPNLDWSNLPARVEGAIGERIERLDARLREVLQVASVEGEEFTAEVVARVVGADKQTIVRQLSRELDQAHHLVRALGVHRNEEVRLSRYRFQHILIQRYLYNNLDAVEQVYQHEAVGHALEELYATRAPELAAQLVRHFTVAMRPEKAATYNEQAGDQARRSAALDVATRYYEAALDQVPARDLAARARLLRTLAECQWVRGRLQDALATSEACNELCEALGDREGAAAAQRLIGRLYWERGDREESLRHYHRSLALLEEGPENIELAHAISAISQMHMLASAYEEAISWGERALELANRLGAEAVIVHALINVGVAYGWTGNPTRGEAMLRESLRRALDLGSPQDTCRAYSNLSRVLARLGRYAEAQATLEEFQQYATRMRMPLYVGSNLVELTSLDWLVGRWREALARRQQIIEWIGQNQSIGYLEVIISNLFGWMLNDLGQPHAAHQALQNTSLTARSQAEPQTTGPHLAQLARALILLGRESDAAEAVRELLDLISRTPDFHPFNTVPLLFLCRWLASRPTSGALLDARVILSALEHADAQLGSPVTAAALSEARGLLALRGGEAPHAARYLQHAAAQWQSLGRPYDQIRALADLERALAGDTAAARAALDQALGLIASLAAQLDAAELKAAFLNSPLIQQLTRRAA
jgi:DNA-binding SARP family transcriptional activator/predicted ATPase